MANPQGCKICESENVNSPADWLITAQSDAAGFEPGFTVWVCQPCLAGLMVAWLQQQEPDPVYAEPVDGPGVLEQIEQDDGQVTPASSKSRRAKSDTGEPEAVARSEELEASAADVNG